jgi:hypothetical protein
MKKDNWIQGVTEEMEKRGTVGAFTQQAKDAGMSVHDFAMKVKDNPSDFTKKTRARATFALNMENIAAKREKMAHGGKLQGYAARQDESLGMRTGKENSKKQSMRGRRDDSYGKFGKRDMENRKISMAHGGKTQGYDDKLNEDLGNRLGRESSYKQTLKDRRDESKAGNKTLGRRAYSSVRTMDKGDRMFAHGGKVHHSQGYDDKLNESLGMRTGKATSKLQTKKDRRDESKAMKKSSGKRAYSAVGTMDKGDRMMARGGSVKGKIDRDRYVKLQREKKKEIEKLRKEKGALRKEVKDCETSGSILTDSVVKGDNKTNNNQALLLGGIAGILFGAFLGRR